MISPALDFNASPAEQLRQGRALVAAGEAMQAEAILRMARAAAWDEDTPFDVIGTRPVRIGADGTPLLDEALPLEVAAALGLSVDAATWLVRDVVNLHARHPRLWRAMTENGFALWQARRVAAECEAVGLDKLECLRVDRQLAPALGLLGWRRLLARLRTAIIEANPDKARRRTEQTRASRYLRTGADTDDPGTSWLAGRLDTCDAREFDLLLDRLADALAAGGATGDRDHLRARAVGLLADDLSEAVALLATLDNPAADDAAGSPAPTTARRPRSRRPHQLYLHLGGPDPDPNGIAEVEGLGPVLADQLAPLLGDRPVKVTPVVHDGAPTAPETDELADRLRCLLGERTIRVGAPIDLATDPAVDSYDIPVPIREHVLARDRHEIFPYSSRRARPCDLDHTIAFVPGGTEQTRPSNLGPLSRRPHRGKTFAGWRLDQPCPGVFWWTSPAGQIYRVDPGGTRNLTPGDPNGNPTNERLRLWTADRQRGGHAPGPPPRSLIPDPREDEWPDHWPDDDLPGHPA